MSNLSRVFEPEMQTTVEASAADDALRLPGPLRGTVTLILQTAFAQRLVNGRTANAERNGFLGLFGFAELLRKIWHGAEAADPYADWWLLKVERALTKAEAEVQALNTRLLAQFSTLEAMVIVPAASVRPVCTSLSFTTAQAFRGAQLIGRCDGVARAVLTARHVGCMPGQIAATSLWKIGHAVRSAFSSVRGYISTAVTRTDLINATPRAAHVVQRMGVLPTVILEETAMPENFPRRQHTTRTGSVVARSLARLDEELGIPAASPEASNDIPTSFEDDLSDLFPT